MQNTELDKLIEVIARLRDPKTGCPWDIKQTHQSLIRYLIEESYECVDALQSENPTRMEEELGDVLLQVILHSQIASEKKQFNIQTVAKKLATKLINRHPHVFQNPQNKRFTEEEINKTWQQEKTKEGKTDHKVISHKDNLFPALLSAHTIGEKSKKFNFDWETTEQVLAKVEEELDELKVEMKKKKNKNIKKIEEEMGDLLFSVAQLSRHLKLTSEEVLHKANAKFIGRFQTLQKLVADADKKLDELSLAEMENFWKKVKKNEKNKK
ncbi:MAG: nucleoside triphosphate pyrophosphohydrolase [Bacteriovoracaceae bacterium]|nr:nucleoside triphosphate pyrophosphohydrolase [Bacteriovoracaceae bacterium]